MSDQLAFQFADPPATAELIAFPASRMRGRLRDTASFILSKPPAKRDWHRRNQAGRVWDEAKRSRLPDHIAGQQMRAFATALENEMRKQVICSILFDHHRDGAA
jgi:hypothetical protein